MVWCQMVAGFTMEFTSLGIWMLNQFRTPETNIIFFVNYMLIKIFKNTIFGTEKL